MRGKQAITIWKNSIGRGKYINNHDATHHPANEQRGLPNADIPNNKNINFISAVLKLILGTILIIKTCLLLFIFRRRDGRSCRRFSGFQGFPGKVVPLIECVNGFKTQIPKLWKETTAGVRSSGREMTQFALRFWKQTLKMEQVKVYHYSLNSSSSLYIPITNRENGTQKRRLDAWRTQKRISDFCAFSFSSRTHHGHCWSIYCRCSW